MWLTTAKENYEIKYSGTMREQNNEQMESKKVIITQVSLPILTSLSTTTIEIMTNQLA